VFEHGGNIVQSHQHSTDVDGARFFMRIEFLYDAKALPREELERRLAALAATLNAAWQIHYGTDRLRMAIAVSKYDHCLLDLLYRIRTGELPVDVPCVVSNHDALRALAEREGIPFHHLPVSNATRREQEKKVVEIIRPVSDFLVLARYMQILTQEFLDEYGKDVINIHHSFLPSFKGANPYRQAFERGVKVIGATAHFATVDLDEGPIIDQVVGRVSHKDSVDVLQRKGRMLEQTALSDAIRAYIEHRVMRYANKTIVFD
jgi:formyltetrahydrofolate deformylase